LEALAEFSNFGGDMKKSIIVLAGFLLGATASQQSRAAAEAADESGALQEIVVTAEKREESAQKTPISMNVYTSAEIVQKGVVDLQSLAQTDPNLNFNRNGGEATLAIRGITTNNTTELGNPSVPVGVDNFFVNRAAALDSMLFDVERIEVLLGPQGTLFGRSSVGGLVNITSAKPTKDFEASSSLELGNYDAINIGGMLNLPINDWLQLRAAVSARKHDGYRTNTYDPLGSIPDRGDDEDSQAGRVTAAFEPSDHFHGWVNFQFESQGGVGPVIQQIQFVDLPNGDISRNKPNLGDPDAFPMYGMPWQRITDKVSKWNFVYDGLPAGISVTYLGGWDSYDWRHSTSSFSYFPFLAPDPSNLFLPIRPFIQTEAPVTQNHELRFTSAPTGFFTWQAGLYYFHELNTLNSQGIVNPGTTDAIPLLQFFYNVDTTSKAGYAQGALHFTEESQLSLGLRYSKDETTRNGIVAIPIVGVPPGPSGDGVYTSSKTTWHVGYDYNWTSRNLLYAKVDTGYKPGGFESCGTFLPEDVTTGEIGSKNRWAADTMQWNTAVFYSDYKNQQIDQFISTCPTGSVTTNAGKSKIYGLETDFKALVDQVGSFDLGFSYLHATYETLSLPPSNGNAGAPSCSRTEEIPQAGGTFAINCILDGNDMVQSPEFVVSAGFDHVWNVASGAVDFRLEGRYTAKQYFDPFNYNDTEQPAYTLLNSYLSYGRDTWKIGLYGRNLTNKGYLNYAQEFTTGGAQQYSYSYGAPRVFGVRLEAHVK
jgi:iron complex outermembrane recepter protein